MIYSEEIRKLTNGRYKIKYATDLSRSSLDKSIETLAKYVAESTSPMCIVELVRLFGIKRFTFKKLLLVHLNFFRNYYSIPISEDAVMCAKLTTVKAKTDPLTYIALVIGLLKCLGIYTNTGAIVLREVYRASRVGVKHPAQLPREMWEANPALKYIIRTDIDRYPEACLYAAINYARPTDPKQLGTGVNTYFPLEIGLADLSKIITNESEKENGTNNDSRNKTISI